MKMKQIQLFLILLAIFAFSPIALADGMEFSEEEVGQGFDFSDESSVQEQPAEQQPAEGQPAGTPPPAGKEQPSSMSFGEEEAGGVGVVTQADKTKMKLGLDAIKDKKYMPGAVAMYDVLKSQAVPLYQSAEYNLALSLLKSDLYRSAQHYFVKIANAGQGHKHFQDSFQFILYLTQKVSEREKVIATLSKYKDAPIDDKLLPLKPRFAFLMAQYYTLRGNYDIAMEWVMQVDKSSKFYPKVRFLEGVIKFNQENFEEAVSILKDVIHMTNPVSGEFKDSELRDKAFLILARIHYAHKQFNAALFYYNKISTDSTDWTDVMFEGSWSLLRLGRYERALGNLITLRSPYFKDYYNPELDILRAVIFYDNCRYDESVVISNRFIENYNDVYKNLNEQLARLTKPEQFYAFILKSRAQSEASASGGQDVFGRIVSLALSDREFNTHSASISEIDQELEKISKLPSFFRSSPLGQGLLTELKAEREELTKLAGEAAKQAFKRETQSIQKLIGQAIRIRIETTAKQQEQLQALARGRAFNTLLKENYFTRAVGDEYEFWSFDGEFWKDELGNYEYVLGYSCRE